MLCVTNMLLHGIENPSFVRHDNTLVRPYISYTTGDRVDIVVTNPPFGGREEDGIGNNFPKHFQTRETADLFLALIIRILKPEGRAAVMLPDGGGDQRTIRFAGRARDDNNFQIDGVDAGGIQEQAQKSQTRLQISQDAIEEYRVNSALYDAEYGTQAGGQIDVETKHGTNDWHGGVFGYLRNSAFDARNFNDFNVLGLPAIPPFRYGQYGMSLGGPVKKDKLFFFLNYEGLRQYGATTNQLLVPNPITARATLAKSPQMCSILQAYAWRASTGAIGNCSPLHVYPDTAFADQTNAANPLPDSDLLTAPAPTTVHEDTWLVRMDYKINDRTMLYGSAHRDISLVSGTNGSGSLPYDLIQTINHPAGYYLAVQNTFSPRLLNEVKVFINRAPFINPQIPPLPYSVTTNNWVTINNNQADHEIGTRGARGQVPDQTICIDRPDIAFTGRSRDTFERGCRAGREWDLDELSGAVVISVGQPPMTRNGRCESPDLIGMTTVQVAFTDRDLVEVRGSAGELC